MQRFCNEPKEINDGDRHHTGALCPCRSDFAKRFDRCRMGGAGAVLSAALARGASAQMAAASNCRGDRVSAARGPAVADAAALLPAGLDGAALVLPVAGRSEEHPSELQSLMRISYAVFR